MAAPAAGRSVRAGAGGGNTSPPPKKPRVNPSKRWCFTWNNPGAGQWELITAWVRDLHGVDFDVGVMQEEVGAGGTPHIQGTLVFSGKTRPLSYFSSALCGFSGSGIHWEKMRGTVDQACVYSSKEATRCGRSFAVGWSPPSELQCLSASDLWVWQRELDTLLAVACCDDRPIHWFWEASGRTGKSAFSRYLAIKRGALSVSGTAANIACAISMYIDKHGRGPPILILDVPRSGRVGVNEIRCIEQVKNGLMFSGKYESAQIIFNSPHVVIFANVAPTFEEWSADRYHVTEISLDSELADFLLPPSGTSQGVLAPQTC